MYVFLPVFDPPYEASRVYEFKIPSLKYKSIMYRVSQIKVFIDLLYSSLIFFRQFKKKYYFHKLKNLMLLFSIGQPVNVRMNKKT